MTLVVSDVTSHGIVMVGDSAITRITRSKNKCEKREKRELSEDLAAKVHYSKEANIGVTVWGDYPSVDEERLDVRVRRFVEEEVCSGMDIEGVAERLTEMLNEKLFPGGGNRDEKRLGLHIAGYKDGLPRLWHIHTGEKEKPQHELRLHKDFPEGQHLCDECAGKYLGDKGFFHLRNGYYPVFAALFDAMMVYGNGVRRFLGCEFPPDDLDGRLEFYKILVSFVADTLVIARRHKGVNKPISYVAFNQSGRQRSHLVEPTCEESSCGGAELRG